MADPSQPSIAQADDDEELPDFEGVDFSGIEPDDSTVKLGHFNIL